MLHDFTLAQRLNSPNILWDNVLAKGALTASSEASNGHGAAAISPATNTGWICAESTGTLTVAGSMASANMAGFAKHTLSGRTVFIEYLVGASWVQSCSVLIESNDPFMLAFVEADSTSWRVRITGGAFSIGVVFIGMAMTVPGVIVPPHVPLNTLETVEIMRGNQSRNGQFLGSEYELYAGKTNITFQPQRSEFILSAEFSGFREYFNRGHPFFIACYGRVYPKDMGYCMRNGAEIAPGWQNAVFMELNMGVEVFRG
ncbi:MAG: hypothetical protein U5N55_01520 [Cypionkella sp.]|nr:hypothetical protein [Cypionkella sp.]